MTGVTTPMPRDTGLALGTLAAWQHEVLVTGQDGFAGLNIEALRTAIDKVGEVRNRWHQIPSVLPVCYGGWRRKRAFRPLLGSNGGLSRLTVAQRLLFESGHPTFEKIETMNRSVWTVKILAAEVMLLAALDWATSGTGEAGTRRHHGDCERFDIFTISSAERFSYERALEEIAEIEQTARQVREGRDGQSHGSAAPGGGTEMGDHTGYRGFQPGAAAGLVRVAAGACHFRHPFPRSDSRMEVVRRNEPGPRRAIAPARHESDGGSALYIRRAQADRSGARWEGRTGACGSWVLRMRRAGATAAWACECARGMSAICDGEG